MSTSRTAKPKYVLAAVGVLFIACALYAGLWFTPPLASGGEVAASDVPIYAEFTPPQHVPPIFVEWVFFESIGELTKEADAIVDGTVVSAEARDVNISREPDHQANPIMESHWVSKVRIERVIKGDFAVGDTVEVAQIITTEPIGMGTPESRGILLLHLYDDVPALPLNPYQGVVPVTDGMAQPRRGDHVWPRGLTEDQFITRLESVM